MVKLIAVIVEYIMFGVQDGVVVSVRSPSEYLSRSQFPSELRLIERDETIFGGAEFESIKNVILC